MKIAVLSVALLTVSSTAHAQELAPQPEIAIGYNNLAGARVNPLGLVDFFDVTFRLRMFESESRVAMQNYVGLGVAGGLSPAWGRIGGIAVVQPLTIVQLYAKYLFVGYFSTFDLLPSFASADAVYSDTAVGDRAEVPATENYATYGGELTLGMRLQLKVGPIAARYHLHAYHVSMQLERGDTTFYDQVHDMLMPNEGWLLNSDLDALWVSDFGLVIGARWSYSHAFYDDVHYGGTTPADPPSNDIHRLGPLIAYIIDENPGGRIESPIIILLTQWHLVHRWRTGADVSTGLPYIGLGFSLRGDLLSDH